MLLRQMLDSREVLLCGFRLLPLSTRSLLLEPLLQLSDAPGLRPPPLPCLPQGLGHLAYPVRVARHAGSVFAPIVDVSEDRRVSLRRFYGRRSLLDDLGEETLELLDASRERVVFFDPLAEPAEVVDCGPPVPVEELSLNGVLVFDGT